MADPATTHVITFETPPVHPYVRTTSMFEIGTNRKENCMKIGDVYFSYTVGVQHFRRRCDGFECETCGPLRSNIILKNIHDHWALLESVYLYRIDITGTSTAERNKVTDAIRDKGGRYVWVETWHRYERQVHVFSSVDHSTYRRNRGRPPRHCDSLTAADALGYLDQLLQHGIIGRDSSRGANGWPLSDGERGRKKFMSQRNQNRVHLSVLGETKMTLIEPEARSLNNRDKKLPWPDDNPHPIGMSKGDTFALFTRAAANVIANTCNVGSSLWD